MLVPPVRRHEHFFDKILTMTNVLIKNANVVTPYEVLDADILCIGQIIEEIGSV